MIMKCVSPECLRFYMYVCMCLYKMCEKKIDWFLLLLEVVFYDLLMLLVVVACWRPKRKNIIELITTTYPKVSVPSGKKK
jgi:hypothetical protein